ncbi:hypothetical protein IMG5_106680 [Ichthyophthirius multifiliis]|uniref:J domain-containing protein n=1 Tax=Ichthyophthirius multifiliis TaxID=5932 RepID=G0QT81_ICHMU|nr:hypothetical protein IMG5_106680 [Ichthyophthirius multifiliis]EGR31575.1 hypothetical protein IMG5_106680 [Ichthyophthirius multifiliis]|eukprot:XP_004035061.1 hypothetical protein IMG5_106680 [Ichthyophthirius multifiliis]
MSRNYYEDLQIERDATKSQVAAAYRKLALRWHPKLSSDDWQTSYNIFSQISEAYEVLSDSIKRAFYDKHGEQKLKNGFFSTAGLQGGYRFGGNPEEIFEKFFGTNNPYQQIYDTDNQENVGSLLSYAFGAQNQPQPQPPNVLNVIVQCTLSELYNGCSKDVIYQRIILNQDGRTTKEIKETKQFQGFRIKKQFQKNRQLEIKPGYKNGQTIRYPRQGNETPGLYNSDLVFIIKEIPHPTLKRKENDLIFRWKCKLIDSLLGNPVQFITLDGRKLHIPIDQIVGPKTYKLIKGEGMTIYNSDEFKVENFNKPLQRGDLYIKFEIEFPTKIDENRRDELIEILGQK